MTLLTNKSNLGTDCASGNFRGCPHSLAEVVMHASWATKIKWTRPQVIASMNCGAPCLAKSYKAHLSEKEAGLTPESVHVTPLLHEDFEVLVDDGHSKQDSGARTNGTHEISHHSESTDAHPTEGSGHGDVTAKHLLHLSLTVAHEGHLLVSELLVHIIGRGAGHFNPGLGEEGTGREHESQVDESVKWIIEDLAEVCRRRNKVCKASNWDRALGVVKLAPLSK